MPKYSLRVVKDDQLDTKHSRSFDSKQELKDEYKRLCEKYNAKKITMDSQNIQRGTALYTLFSKGLCKHGKTVHLEQAATEIINPISYCNII